MWSSESLVCSEGDLLPDPPLVAENRVLRKWDQNDLPLVRKASTSAELLGGTMLPDPFTVDEGLAFIRRQWHRAERGEGLALANSGASLLVARCLCSAAAR